MRINTDLVANFTHIYRIVVTFLSRVFICSARVFPCLPEIQISAHKKLLTSS